MKKELSLEEKKKILVSIYRKYTTFVTKII